MTYSLVKLERALCSAKGSVSAFLSLDRQYECSSSLFTNFNANAKVSSFV